MTGAQAEGTVTSDGNGTQGNSNTPESQQVTQATLASYLSQLHRGQAPAQRFVSVDQSRQSECRTQNADAVSNVLSMIDRRVAVTRSRYGHRGNAHIGEASHPGPAEICNQPAAQVRKDPTGYDGQRVGEASHPGPKTTMIIPQMVSTTTVVTSIAIVLSICDGMGCGLMGLRANNAAFDKYLAVEISEDAKIIARNANPDNPGKPRIDHGWHSNLYNITEEDIAALGHDSIKLFQSLEAHNSQKF